MANPSTHRHSSYYYRDGAIEELRPIYSNKCAYCETSASAGADLRVDHFRPKQKLIENTNHGGYYWLTYEWSNLILACEKCNGKKSNRFPIHTEANRIFIPRLDSSGHCTSEYRNTHSTIYTSEAPILLNPEADDVEQHLIFKPNGEVTGLTSRGNETISILDLNRPTLVIARKKMIDGLLNDIHACVDDYIQSGSETHIRLSLKRVFNKMSDLQVPSKEYSRLGWFLFYKFDIFFLQRLPSKEAEIIKKAFNQYIQNTL